MMRAAVSRGGTRLPVHTLCRTAAAALLSTVLAGSAAAQSPRPTPTALSARAEAFSLAPDTAELAVGRSQRLYPIRDDCAGDPSDCLLPPGASAPVRRWTVNGIEGGDDTVGRVRALPDGGAEYTAPARAPKANPVSVAALIAGTGRARVWATREILIVGPAPRWIGWVEVLAHESLAGREGVFSQQGELHYRLRMPLGPVLSESVEDDGSRFVALQFDAPAAAQLQVRLRTDLGPESCNVERWRTVDLATQPGAPAAPLPWTLRVSAAGEVRADFLPLPPLMLGGQEELAVKGCGTGTRIAPIAPQVMSFEGLTGPFIAPRPDAQGVSSGQFRRQTTWRIEGRERPITLSVRWELRRPN